MSRIEVLTDVGLFKSKLAVWNPASPSRVEELELLVDTGASYSWFMRETGGAGDTANRKDAIPDD